MAKRVSVINFKGGVGKTTLAFHLGTGLARFHDTRRVLLVDMDHQSSLSIVCLGAKKWKDAVHHRRTIDQVFRPFIEHNSDFPRDELVIKNPLNKHSHKYYTTLDIVPASLALDNIEIELTASHRGNAIDSEWSKRTLICRWLEETKLDSIYDYIIFDCPPATKIVSQNAISASHGYIIPVIPEAVMERGSAHLHGMMQTQIDERLKALMSLGDRRKVHVPDTKLVGLVVTRIQTSGSAYSGYTDNHTLHLRSLQRYWGEQLVRPYISQGIGLSEALTEGVPVYDRGDTQNVGGRGLDTQYENLTAELKQRIDAL